MSDISEYKLPWKNLTLAAVLIVVLWITLFVVIPFLAVPAALSDNSVMVSITTRLNLTAVGFVVLLFLLAKYRVSEKQFWQTCLVYGASWIVVSVLGEGGAEKVFALRDRGVVDTGNAVIITFINSGTFIGPGVVTLIFFLRMRKQFDALKTVGTAPTARQENPTVKREPVGNSISETSHLADGFNRSANNPPPNSSENETQSTHEDDWSKMGYSTATTEGAADNGSDKVRQIKVEETENLTKELSGWAEEFTILHEYDPIVTECHDELDEIDPQLSIKFREEVVTNRKSAADIRDRLIAEHNRKLKPYKSDDLNAALSEIRTLGQDAEEEFLRVIEVMGEDVVAENVVSHMKEKFGVSLPPEDARVQLDEWGIRFFDGKYYVGDNINKTLVEAIAFAQETTDDFFNNASASNLKDLLISSGFKIQRTLGGNDNITDTHGNSESLVMFELPRYIKEKIAQKDILIYAMSKITSNGKTRSGL
jgi:hypothetical protein